MRRVATTSAKSGGAASDLAQESDEDLAFLIGKGNKAAFQALMERHINMHISFAERMMGSRQEAEDIVQDAFTKLWIHAGKFDPKRAKFSTWFYRIVLNRCLDQKRKKKPVALPENYEPPDERENPMESLATRQKQNRVVRALGEIPERQRAAITMCYFEGISNREAAEILDMNIKALESLLCRGRKNLKSLLEKAD